MRQIIVPGTNIELTVSKNQGIRYYQDETREISREPLSNEDISEIAGSLEMIFSDERRSDWAWNLREITIASRFLGLHNLIPVLVTSPDEGIRVMSERLAEIRSNPGMIPGTGLDRDEPNLLEAINRLSGHRLSLIQGVTDPEPPSGFLWISQGPFTAVPDSDTWSLDFVSPEGPRVRVIENGRVCQTKIALWSSQGSEDLGLRKLAQVTDQGALYDLSGSAIVPLRSIPDRSLIWTYAFLEYSALRYIADHRTGTVTYRGPAGDLVKAHEIGASKKPCLQTDLSVYLRDPVNKFLRVLDRYYRRLGVISNTRKEIEVIHGEDRRRLILDDPTEEDGDSPDPWGRIVPSDVFRGIWK